jgi:hypothetical protein
MKIFDGYVKNYHTFNLTIHHGKHSFSMTEIEYFSKLGSMLGYSSFTEDTCNGNNNPMDLTWWDNDDGEYWNDFVLHLERENFFKKDLETLDKLFCIRDIVPTNVIGIMNVKNLDRIEELITKARELSEVSNALLVFKTTTSGKSQDYFDEVHAILLDKNKIISRKTAYVSVIGDTLFMHFNKER